MRDKSITILETSTGKLEMSSEYPFKDHPTGVGVICQPHPLHGGSMQNKVVTTTARAFREAHLISIRFNFRGVGNSEGKYDHGIGETMDALNVLQWAHQYLPDKPLYLAGFSFGAYVALQTAIQTNLSLQHLILIAPAVKHADFTALQAPCPWSVVIAENDTIALAQDIYQWVETRHPRPALLSFAQSSHFFDGQLILLKQRLKDLLC